MTILSRERGPTVSRDNRLALVDVHHHAIPACYLAALAKVGIDTPVKGASFPHWSADTSLEAMDGAGILLAVLSVSAPGLGSFTGDAARRVARDVNEYLARLVEERPSRFAAFALLPMDDAENARAEAEYALDTLHLHGVGLFTSAHGRYLGDPHLEPLMAELAARKVPVFVHPNVPAVAAPSFGLPASVIEFPLETTRAVANLLFSGTLDRYPDLSMILSHGGGAVPYLARRMTHAAAINPALRGRPPVDLLGSLRRLYYDVAMAATPEQLACLCTVVGPERILFGSDFPFMPREQAIENAAGLRHFEEVTETQRNWIGRGCALRLFPAIAERLVGTDAGEGATPEIGGATAGR
jgi:predicted TIM-barrel fold metal-dependent hydrolase